MLKILKKLGGESCLREVVRRIAEREVGPDFDRRLLKSIHVSLLQTHLPKMEGAGLIEYNETTGTVRLLELPKDIRYRLEVVEKGDIPWSEYYLLLSLLGLAAGLVLRNFLAVILALCFLVAAIIHTSQTRGVLSMINESLTRVKHQLTKFLNATNKSAKKEKEE